MKKKILACFLLLCLIPGCGIFKHNEIEKSNVEDVKAEALIVFDEMRNGIYTNMEIKTKELDIPDLETISSYKVDYEYIFHDYSARETMELCVDEVIPKTIGEFDKKCLYDSKKYMAIKREEIPESDKKYEEADYFHMMNEINSYEKLPSLYYYDTTNNKKMEILQSGGITYSAGVLGTLVGEPVTFGISSFMEYEKSYNVYTDELDDTYMLLDGEISIEKAVENVEKFYDETFPLTTQNTIKSKVYRVDVYQLTGTEYYVFNMKRTEVLDGIRFCPKENGDVTMGKEPSNPLGHEYGIMSECFMIESDKVDMSFGQVNNYKEVRKDCTYSEVVGFDTAALMTAEYLSDLPSEVYEVTYVGLEYKVYLGTDEMDYDIYLKPNWKFEIINPLNQDTIEITIDLEDGTLRKKMNEI